MARDRLMVGCSEARSTASQFSMSAGWRESHLRRAMASGMDSQCQSEKAIMIYTFNHSIGESLENKPSIVMGTNAGTVAQARTYVVITLFIVRI